MATDSTHLLPSDTSVETESDMAGNAPDFGSVQLAAASGDAPISVQLPQHAPVIVIPVKPGQTIELPTDSADGLLAKLGADGNLAIVIDGRTIILQGYAQANADPDHPVKIVTNDGDVVDVNEVIVNTNPDVALDIQTAAGPAAAGAQGGTNGPDAAGSGIFVPFAAGPLLNGFNAAGVLGATELQYKTITDERILFPIEEGEQAPTPTPHISIAAEDGIDPVCIHEDSQGEAILVEASTDAGSHLTSVVISGFPIGGAGFNFNFSGLDTDGAGTDVTVDTSKLALFGEVTVTFAGTQTNYNGAFIVTPPADSDVDLGTLTAKVEAANDIDPTVKADSSDDALIIVDAVADGDDVGDDGDADKLSITIGITDGGDANGSFQNGETGTVVLKATFDDFKDGSETHTLTVTAPDGFTFGGPSLIPLGVSVVSNDGTTIVFSVDSHDGDGQDGLGAILIQVPVTYNGGESDGATGDFVATVSTVETPTDEECDLTNNEDTATQATSAIIATTPTPGVQIGAEAGLDHVCVFEDTTSDPIALTASTNAGSHLTTIVISGFPVGGAGFSFDLTGLDLPTTTITDKIAVDGTVIITFDNATTTGFGGTFTVTPPADSDIDLGTLTATVNAANDVDTNVTASANDQAAVIVDAVADGDDVGDDGDASVLSIGIAITDGGDANGSFQAGEIGTATITATFDDFHDGSEVHQLIVNAAPGFIFLAPPPPPPGLTLLVFTPNLIVFGIDSSDAIPPVGVGNMAIPLPVQFLGGPDGQSAPFIATVTTGEIPTDQECDLTNNFDTATQIATTTIAGTPRPTVDVAGDVDHVCIYEDTTSDPIPLTASTTAGSHLTSIVITGFPVGGGGFTFDFSGLDTDGAGTGVTVDTSQLATLGQVTVTFTGTQTAFNGSFTVTPAADSDVDLGTLTATVNAANNVDPSVTATTFDQAEIVVDAVADGDDGDADKLGVTITSIVDGIDGNTTFQPNEAGKVNISATFDDFKDGSEAHRLTVDAAVGFAFNPGDVGVLPAGVVLNLGLSSATHLVFDVDSSDPGGVGSLALSIPVTYFGGQPDGVSGDFTATVTAVETPSDEECTTENNSASASDTEATTIAKAPTTDVRVGAEGNTEILCVPEDSAGVAVPVAASASAGSHLTSIVITGFPIGGGAFTFNFAGPDTDGGGAGVTVDTSQLNALGQVTINFTGLQTLYSGSFTVIPAADSDVDLGTLTATVTAANNVDPSVTATDSDQAYVRVDAIADGDDGDADKLGVTITSIVDGADANSTFQANETGRVNISATFDDFKDGSEAHRLTVDAAAGFTFNLGDVGTLPAGVVLNVALSTTTHLVFDIDSHDGDGQNGVGSLSLSIPVTCDAAVPEGPTGNFTATVTAQENPTDLECNPENNFALLSDTEATIIAKIPTTNVQLGVEGNTDFVCVPEDSAGVPVPVAASASIGSHLTSIVITGFPIGATGFTFNFAGLDLGSDWTVDTSQLVTLGQVTVNFAGIHTGYLGSFTVIPAADSDVDLGTLTAVVTAASDVDPSVTASDSDQAYVRVDAVADGDDGDASKLGVTITSIVDGVDGNTTFQVGETGKVNISATFDDFKDGSETHTLTVDAPTGFTFNLLDVGTLPTGVTLDGSSTTTHLVFNVDSKDSPVPLGVGSLSLSIPVTYNGGVSDGSSGNFTATVTAQENPTDLECDLTNNKATQSDTEATFINNDLATGTLKADGCVFEDNEPNQYTGDTTKVFEHLDVSFTPTDNETITGASITIPTNWQVQVWDTGGNSVVTTLGAGSDVDISAYIANILSGVYQLRPVPPANTDVDGSFNIKLNIQDPDSGLTDTLTNNFTVYVDAVADKPTSVDIIVKDSAADANSSFALGETGTLQVKATFGDTADNSEVHTLTVTLQSGFTAPTLSANGTLDGFAYTYNQATGVIVFTVPNGTASFDETFSVKAPTSGTLPSNLVFTVDATATETNLSGGGCDTGNVDLAANNKATTSDQTGIPASRLLTGEFITNTNVQDQQLLITFVNAANFLEADAQIYSLGLQGQQGNVAQDAGFDINGSAPYLLSVEAAVNPKIILTDMSLESTNLHDSGNIQFEINNTTGGPDRNAYTWIMTPDSAVPNQGETASTDGDGGANSLTDSTSLTFNYLNGADGADTLKGGDGSDILNGGSPLTGADGIDNLNGGAGTDILVYDWLHNDHLDGGTGNDILRIDIGAINITKHEDGTLAGSPTAAETTVDLSGKDIHNVEAILLTTEAVPDDNFGTTIRLKAADVLNYSEQDVSDAQYHSLYVIGQKGDQVQLFTSDAANWVDGDANAANGVTATGSVTIGSQVFNIYTASNGAHLYVDQDVTVTTAA